MNFVYVFLGGGLGAIARYGISRITPASDNGFPLATFVTNVLSCILLGALLGYLAQKQLSFRSQLLFMTGFCGGFSTFSTFSAEAYKLIENGNSGMAMTYIGMSILVSLVAIYLGLKIVELV